jgi:hypothetical protein
LKTKAEIDAYAAAAQADSALVLCDVLIAQGKIQQAITEAIISEDFGRARALSKDFARGPIEPPPWRKASYGYPAELLENQEALAAVERGLEQAAEGQPAPAVFGKSPISGP